MQPMAAPLARCDLRQRPGGEKQDTPEGLANRWKEALAIMDPASNHPDSVWPGDSAKARRIRYFVPNHKRGVCCKRPAAKTSARSPV